jgi:hypothetical protein
MKKILFVIANYNDGRQQFFEQYFSPRNQKFADIHGYRYLVSKGGNLFRENPTWWKFTLLKEMIDSGMVSHGDEVLHLDADMRIDKFEQDYPCNKSFTLAIDNGNTFCMGSYKIKINDWSINLVNNILDEGLWNRRKHEPHWEMFREQAAFYTLCGIQAHSWSPFFDYPNYGWNMVPTEDMRYGIDELHQHVEILRPEWNTTLLEEDMNQAPEYLHKFNIVKSKKSDTIIRHFAGGQPWQN